MKGYFSSLGWILFLGAIGAGLVFYNFIYVPMESRMMRMEREITMWTERVDELSDSLKILTSGPDTVFNISYLFDELFNSPESLKLSAAGESKLRAILPQLVNGPVIEVIGSSGSRVSKTSLWQNPWDYSAVAAATVARRLIGLGVPAGKIRVISIGDRTQNEPDAQVLNRRIDIVVRSR